MSVADYLETPVIEGLSQGCEWCGFPVDPQFSVPASGGCWICNPSGTGNPPGSPEQKAAARRAHEEIAAAARANPPLPRMPEWASFTRTGLRGEGLGRLVLRGRILVSEFMIVRGRLDGRDVWARRSNVGWTPDRKQASSAVTRSQVRALRARLLSGGGVSTVRVVRVRRWRARYEAGRRRTTPRRSVT